MQRAPTGMRRRTGAHYVQVRAKVERFMDEPNRGAPPPTQPRLRQETLQPVMNQRPTPTMRTRNDPRPY